MPLKAYLAELAESEQPDGGAGHEARSAQQANGYVHGCKPHARRIAARLRLEMGGPRRSIFAWRSLASLALRMKCFHARSRRLYWRMLMSQAVGLLSLVNQ